MKKAKFVRKRIFFNVTGFTFRQLQLIDTRVSRSWYIHSSGYNRDGLLYYDVATREPESTWGNWRPYAD